MAKARYKDYRGRVIGKWRILGEEPYNPDPSWTPQRRYTRRPFKCEHVETGEVKVLTLSSMKTHRQKITNTRCHRDHTDEVYNHWRIVRYANDEAEWGDALTRGSLWVCENQITGEIKKFTLDALKKQCFTGRKKSRHGYRSSLMNSKHVYLYRIWSRLRQNCLGGREINNNEYKHWGGLGYTVDRERWALFAVFLKDVLECAGERPEDGNRWGLVPTEGKHFCQGNVMWARRDPKSHFLPRLTETKYD